MAGNGLIGIKVGRGLQVEPIGSLRNERGQYTSTGVNAQLDANRNIAIDIQAKVVQRMRNHIAFGRRASASTGRLVRATADPQNLTVSKEFIGVGNTTWLDRSSAKYWRTFEEGSEFWGFVGRPVYFKGRFSFPSAHGDTPGIRSASGDYEGRRATFVVQHEIQPANIYGDVASEYRGNIPALSVQFARRVLNDALKEVVVRGAG